MIGQTYTKEDLINFLNQEDIPANARLSHIYLGNSIMKGHGLKFSWIHSEDDEEHRTFMIEAEKQ